MGNVSKLQYSHEKRSCRLFDIDQITPKIRVCVELHVALYVHV